MFNRRPIELAGFRLLARKAIPKGKPTLQQWIAAAQFSSATADASPYWIGDLLCYAENRQDWKDKFDQAVALTGLAHQTIYNLTYISRHVEEPERALAPSMAHAAQVASLERPRQTKWLQAAVTEGWTARELRAELRAERRRAVIDGQARLEGMFRVLYADPPWIYGDRQPSGSSSAAHFPGMTIAQLCALPVEAHALPNALLAMWTTAPLLLANPGPREVGEAWGFTYKQQWVWDKVDGAGGNYSQGNHEVLTLWTRGSCVPDVQTDLPDSVVTIRKSRQHSEKPAEFRRLLEKHWTTGPYLELFGRERVEGWTVFGNDAKLWGRQAEARTA